MRHPRRLGLGTEITLDEVHFMSGGRRLMGIVEGESKPDMFIPELIELYRSGGFPFDKLVTFYEFDQITRRSTTARRARRSSRSCACTDPGRLDLPAKPLPGRLLQSRCLVASATS